MRDRIPINKELVPYNFEIALADTTFLVGVDYNYTGDFFTLSLNDLEGNIISRGEKLVYNMQLWADIYDNRTFPCLTIKPVDAGYNEKQITWFNFGKTIFLEIFDELEEEATE